jgi:hypothetical protein
VTSPSTQPAKRPGTAGQDVKTFATAVLLTFGVGLLGMVGWAVLGSGFGGFLGLLGGLFGVLWWRHAHGKVVPENLKTRSVLLLLVVNVVLGVILLVSAG